MLLLNARIDLSNGTSIVINHRNRASISIPLKYQGDIALPDFGIYSNTGTIDFIDRLIPEEGNPDGGVYEVYQYARQNLLVENLPVYVYLQNTLTKKSTSICKMFTDTWNYDNGKHTVSVSLTDGLQRWQDIEVDGIKYDPIKGKRSLAEVYNYLRDITVANGFDMLAIDELSEVTQDRLNNIKSSYLYLSAGNLWAEWDKLCKALMAHIYVNSNNRLEFRIMEL